MERRADAAAANMGAFLLQDIFLDFWAGDLRDNDNNGLVDGFRTWVALGLPAGRTVRLTRSTSTPRLRCATACAQTWCPTLIALQASPSRGVGGCVTSSTGSEPTLRLASGLSPLFRAHPRRGDVICSYSPIEGHGHSGMVVTSGHTPDAVHLPGPRQHIARGVCQRQSESPQFSPV